MAIQIIIDRTESFVKYFCFLVKSNKTLGVIIHFYQKKIVANKQNIQKISILLLEFLFYSY